MTSQVKNLLADWILAETAALENTVSDLGLLTADEIECIEVTPANDNGAAFPVDAESFTTIFGF